VKILYFFTLSIIRLALLLGETSRKKLGGRHNILVVFFELLVLRLLAFSEASIFIYVVWVKSFYEAVCATCTVVLLVGAAVSINLMLLVLVGKHCVDHALRVAVRIDAARHPDQTCYSWV